VAVIAQVKLNGKDLGTLWKPPFRLNVTGALANGDNRLEVRVTNLWPNRLIGDEQLPEDSQRNADGTLKEWPQWLLEGKPNPTGRRTFTTWRLWKKSDTLLESGLLGPVRIVAPTEVDLAAAGSVRSTGSSRNATPLPPEGGTTNDAPPEGRTTSGAPHWDLRILSRAPKLFPVKEPAGKDVQSIFYQGFPFRNKPTRVFAFYGLPKTPPAAKVPGMVLVHGGGGTAFDAWVRLWNSRGYAAIAMDLCGCLPVGSYGNWKRHDAGAPPGWGGFDQIDWPQEDQWTYQAVADVLLAHSLLRSFPQVDKERVGVTGISWGGYLTCIVAGADPRFRFAVPVYGCGFLGEDSAWLSTFAGMGPEKSRRWLAWWDPSVWLGAARMPMLWVTGTNDFAYPLDSLQKSYRLPRGPRALAIRVRMPHGHGGAGENPGEILAFAEGQLGRGAGLARITAQGRTGRRAWATYQSPVPLRRAELTYTTQTGPWQNRLWKTTTAELDQAACKAAAELPEGVKVYYLNLIDQRDLLVSTEHEEVKP
jgi:dienelactone hydrolase